MQQDSFRQLNVGHDPRELAEYEKLRAEINKLSQISQPEVNWQYVHELAEKIFEKQGVDLQTTVYFVLARSHLYGLTGFTEGCEFLANLIITQWDNVWPPPRQARVRTDLLDWFIARISEVIHHYVISSDDKRLIYRCEHALQLVSEKLYAVGLPRVPRIENLLHFIEGYTCLFDKTDIVVANEHEQAQKTHHTAIPPVVYFHSDPPAHTGSKTTVSTERGTQQPVKGTITVSREATRQHPAGVKQTATFSIRHRHPPYRWWWFLAGAVSGGLLAALIIIGISGYQDIRFQQQQALSRLLTPQSTFPERLSAREIRQLRNQAGSELQQQQNLIINHWQQQLTKLRQLPSWFIWQYQDDLSHTLNQLYPDSVAASTPGTHWQQQQTAMRKPGMEETAWLAASQQTEALINHLLSTERQRKSLTLSWLKTAAYNLQQQMNSQPPVSVQIHLLEQQRAEGKPVSSAQISILSEELNALNFRLWLLQKTSEPVSASAPVVTVPVQVSAP